MPRSRVRVPLSPPVKSSTWLSAQARTIASAGLLRDPQFATPRVASRLGQRNLTFLGSPRGVPKRLEDVFALEVRIFRKEIVDAASGSDLSDDHTDGSARSVDASLAAHDFGPPCDAI